MRWIKIQFALFDPDDFFLIGIESLIVLGLVLALFFAYRVQVRHSSLTSQGWFHIITGLFFLLLHAIFDVLDTLQWDDFVVDVLNVLDGSCFVAGLLLFAFGIYGIAKYGAKLWEA